MLRNYILPRIMRQEKRELGFLQRLKDSLTFYLNTTKFPIDDVYSAHEPVVSLPDDPMNYYRWAWEVLFPAEDYRVKSLASFEEDKNIGLP